MRKIVVILIIALALVIRVTGADAKNAGTKAVNVSNKACPVSGDPVNTKNPVTYEYKGKVYNLCCSACIEPFKKNPEKYAKIAEGKAK